MILLADAYSSIGSQPSLEISPTLLKSVSNMESKFWKFPHTFITHSTGKSALR